MTNIKTAYECLRCQTTKGQAEFNLRPTWGWQAKGGRRAHMCRACDNELRDALVKARRAIRRTVTADAEQAERAAPCGTPEFSKAHVKNWRGIAA